MKKNVLYFIVLMTAMVVLGSCSSDENKYQSKLPVFSGVQVSPEVVYSGEEVKVTAVQHSKGTLLNYTTYVWSSSMPDDVKLNYQTRVVYDQDSSNPTCTFVAPSTPGRYTLTFKGTYGISGQAGNSTSNVDLNDGTITYSYTPLEAYVTITKSITVKNRN